MAEKVWQTTVYNKSNVIIGKYHFRNQADVIQSVIASWSKQPDEIKKLNMADTSLVWVYENNAVAVEAIEITLNIRDNWTHF